MARFPGGAFLRWARRPPGHSRGCVLKSVSCLGLAAALALVPTTPATSQDIFGGFVLARVCLPYAGRVQSFEATLRAARDMEFRHSTGVVPIDDWASEIELVSKDGAWWVTFGENTVMDGEREIYAVSCSIRSKRASARELSVVASMVLRRNENWTSSDPEARRWTRRITRPDAISLNVEVEDTGDGRPTLSATGSYH